MCDNESSEMIQTMFNSIQRFGAFIFGSCLKLPCISDVKITSFDKARPIPQRSTAD